MSLTPAETSQLVELLSKMERPYPEALFLALCKSMIMVPVELVPVTRSGKVLMLRRPADDPLFSHLWHTSGSLQLKGDTIETVLQRIIEKELDGLYCSDMTFIGYHDVMHGGGLDENPRGQERPLIFAAWVDESAYSGEGQFFPIDELPEDTLSMHAHKLLPLVREKLFASKD